VDRRTFLARLGILGAAAGAGVLIPAAAHADTDIPTLVREIMAALVQDTFNAVGAFVAPGDDQYSTAQGTPRAEPGALAARTPEFLVSFFDHYVALPPELVRGIGTALAGGLADVPVVLPDGTPVIVPGVLEAMDDAVRLALTGPDAVPLSGVIALLLNLVATQVNPASVSGPFVSPYARLSFPEKAGVLSVLEREDSPLVTSLTDLLGPQLGATIGGLIRFLSGSLVEMAAFGTYSEWAEFNPTTRSVRRRPVGWNISRWDPGVLDGWDDFKGYYQGRRKAVG
jgi:hypothetical protein